MAWDVRRGPRTRAVTVTRKFLGLFEKLRNASQCLSVRPHGTSPLPLGGFISNLIFEDFSKNVIRENSSLIKTGQE